MISADTMIGYSESQKCAELFRVFSDAYKSPMSVILIDDIERIIDYAPIGPRFSNTVLQTLLVLLRKVPPVTSRLLVVATTSIAHFMEDLQLVQAFNVSLHVSQLQSPDEIAAALMEYSPISRDDIDSIARSVTKPIGIKQLLMVLEMARSDGSDAIPPEQFLECLHTAGY
jgi:vesicle-fusing ATPase